MYQYCLNNKTKYLFCPLTIIGTLSEAYDD